MVSAERLAAWLTRHAGVVIVIMVLASLIIGAGMAAVDQSPGLDQFEFETEEGDALTYINDHFDVADNETSVQVVIRNQDNALSKDSFLDTLALQQDLVDDPAVNATLTEDPFRDLASTVATEAMRAERIDELEAEGEALEAAFEDLNESAAELEADAESFEEDVAELEAAAAELNASAAALEADAAAFEEERDALEADSVALQERIEPLRSALETTIGLERQHAAGELTEAEADAQIAAVWSDAQVNASLDAEQNETFTAVGEQVRERTRLEIKREQLIAQGPAEITDNVTAQAILRDGLNETIELQAAYDAADTDEERASVNATIEETWETTSEDAWLTEEQAEAYRELGQDVRTLSATINEIGPLSQLIEAGSAGVFADELQELEARQAELEATGEELAEREAELEARGEEIEAWQADLEARGEELEERQDALEREGDALEADAERLEGEMEALVEFEPTRTEQREYLENMSEAEVEAQVQDLLGEDGAPGAFAFVPTDFEPGSTQTDARTLFIHQTTDEPDVVAGDAPVALVDSQLRMASIVDDRFGEGGFTFGIGVITDEIDRSMGDSLGLVLPLALLFVVIVLSIAYRDPLDIVLGVAGIALVLVWTFGFLGWTGIVFNQIMIAVPVLLVGLSIDYAIHVFMRHRERRAEEAGSTRDAMRIVLIGLGVALVWVTITAVIGFLSNLVSPVPPIRDFGIVSAFGIVATLLIFGLLVPAVKIVLDDALEARGFDRRRRAFGTGGGRLTDSLDLGNRLAQRAPLLILLVVLVITAGGVYGAMQVDTEFRQEDFIADAPPAWMGHLPDRIAPGEYQVKDNLEFVNERFVRGDANTQILVRGDITQDDTLERLDAAETAAKSEPAVITRADGEADLNTPLTSMRSLADRDEAFADVFEAADTTGDDVPDTNITGVYDAYFEAAPDEAAAFIRRTDGGEYEAARLALSIRGDATAGEAAAATRSVADHIADENTEAIATGQLVVFYVIEGGLFDAVIESLLVTLVAVFAFLMAAYRLVHGSALLGAITLTPIVLTVAWILGTMHLLDIPFNVVTGTITSLTIGLGVAYNIHISERYRLELNRGHDAVEAMRRAVTGTGGALLGSAATTVGGFGVLVFAILPPLQQFGIITGLTIIYAFLGSVLVLPTLLMLWTRYRGPGVPTPVRSEKPAWWRQLLPGD